MKMGGASLCFGFRPSSTAPPGAKKKRCIGPLRSTLAALVATGPLQVSFWGKKNLPFGKQLRGAHSPCFISDESSLNLFTGSFAVA